MKLKRSPLSVALITLALCLAIGIVVFLVFGDHSYSARRSESSSFAFGRAIGIVSTPIAIIAYLVQRHRVNAQWASSIESSAGAPGQAIE